MCRQTRVRAAGFTLIELLAVVAIIGLLIGILVPTIGAARRAGKTAASKATLGTIGTALEQFASDEKFGGRYPPSHSDRDTSGADTVTVRSPYVSGSGTDIQISGAGLLVWALAGADFAGTPGFKVFRTGSSTKWSEDTDAQNTSNDPTQSGAYAWRNDNTGLPVQARATYLAADSVKTTPRHPINSAKFVIPSEVSRDERDYPMFLDTFGYPILYYRADPTGRTWVDREIEGAAQRGIYHWIDNAALVAETGAQPSGVTNAKLKLYDESAPHKLGWDAGGTFQDANGVPTGTPPSGSFQGFIRNEKVQGRHTPFRPDSYLLLSPGSDGLYGTSDDVTNFK